MTSPRYLPIFIVFILWAYFTHLFPANLNRLALNTWTSSQAKAAWTSTSLSGKKNAPPVAFHRLRKRRDRNPSDHLHRHFSAKVLLAAGFHLFAAPISAFPPGTESPPRRFPSTPPSPPPKFRLI